MTPNNNLSPLPFYSYINEQDIRKWWVYGKAFPLYAHQTYLLPFQIIANGYTTTGETITVVAVNIDTGTRTTISPTISQKTFATFSVFVYTGGGISAILPEGRYYLLFTVGSAGASTVTAFSDVFTAVASVSLLTKLQWWDEADFRLDDGSAIVYTSPTYKNTLYLPIDIAKPEYTFEEETEERDGFSFPTKQISKKVYHFSMWAPEYLLDVMRLIRMSDHIQITDGSRTYDADTFLMTPEWESNGDVASVAVEFSADTVAKKIGLAYTQQS